MPRNADGPKFGSQNYFFVPAALQAELSHADKYRLPYEATHGTQLMIPFRCRDALSVSIGAQN
jgi:hypothetical protein